MSQNNGVGRYDEFIKSCDESIERTHKKVLQWMDATPRLGRLFSITFFPELRELYRDKKAEGVINPWWHKRLVK